ncbi:DUF4345 domain-containing protein [Caulobacter vibrioides]|uniref:DUF4345 domain-containing protein n=1 Tax=Caulobacter vibrioides TaxID=155892 RepID=UPI000BB4CA66|nr:DUF4345 domain-containing protein [Caulobacter vibrioides]ATC24764.1 DUF4345 domain-containing protein [Caulobacter vibrioides]PLR09540.1 DUF4345 domain-containing protein [Caulobacter vibrioides]
MSPFPFRPALLLAAGSIALVIGVAILADPVGFHAAGGVRLSAEAGLLNEMRAAGGAILAVGLLALIGVFTVALRTVALTACAVVYSGYGLARLFSFLVDGVPNPALVWITALELVMGTACFVAAAAPSRSRASAQG